MVHTNLFDKCALLIYGKSLEGIDSALFSSVQKIDLQELDPIVIYCLLQHLIADNMCPHFHCTPVCPFSPNIRVVNVCKLKWLVGTFSSCK